MIKSVVFNRSDQFYNREFNYKNLLSLWYVNYRMNIIEEYSPCYAEGTHLNADDVSLEIHTATIDNVPLAIPFSISEDRIFGIPGEFNNGFGFVAKYAIEELHKDTIRIKTILDNCSDELYHIETISSKMFDFLLEKLDLEGGVVQYE